MEVAKSTKTVMEKISNINCYKLNIMIVAKANIAIAQEYLRKNNKNYNEEFVKGAILPDLTTDKSKTHYGN